MMCKHIFVLIQQLYSRVFERKTGGSMNTKVREAILDHICYVLPEWHDEGIFRATSFESLGKLYFDNIRTCVDGATDDLIKEVIQAMVTPEECMLQRDFWLALPTLIHIKKLPIEVFKKLKHEYNTAYKAGYITVKNKYSAKISSLNSNIARLEKERDEIKKRVQKSRSITHDISCDEERYRTVCSEHYQAITRKEQLSFAFTAICNRLDAFCRIDEPESQLNNWLRRKSIELATSGADIDIIFLPFTCFLSSLEKDIDDDRFVFNQVKRLALVDIYREKQHTAIYITDDEKRQNIIKEYAMAMAAIPSPDDLLDAYTKGSNDYLRILDHLINEFDVLQLINNDIDNCISLQARADLLRDVLSLYIAGNYALFNCTVPIQIEGMFADFLYAATTFNRFTELDLFERDVMDVKVDKLAHCSEIDHEVVEYFGYYFTNIIRNRAAHGRYIKARDAKDDEVFAKELLLDMYCLTHQVRRKAEIEKMFRCITGYIEYCSMIGTSSPDSIYGALYRDFTGERLHLSFDSLDQYRPIQFLYWIINPYYEKIFQTMSADAAVKRIRDYLYHEDFWKYTYSKMKQDIECGNRFDPEVLSAINCMFKCPLSSEAKKLLSKIHSILSK